MSVHTGKGGTERERERIPSRLHAGSTKPDVGLNLMRENQELRVGR